MSFRLTTLTYSTFDVWYPFCEPSQAEMCWCFQLHDLPSAGTHFAPRSCGKNVARCLELMGRFDIKRQVESFFCWWGVCVSKSSHQSKARLKCSFSIVRYEFMFLSLFHFGRNDCSLVLPSWRASKFPELLTQYLKVAIKTQAPRRLFLLGSKLKFGKCWKIISQQRSAFRLSLARFVLNFAGCNCILRGPVARW